MNKTELKRSLFGGISLVMQKNGAFAWVTFEEIASYYEDGFTLLNDDKHTLYKRRGKDGNRREV